MNYWIVTKETTISSETLRIFKYTESMFKMVMELASKIYLVWSWDHTEAFKHPFWDFSIVNFFRFVLNSDFTVRLVINKISNNCDALWRYFKNSSWVYLRVCKQSFKLISIRQGHDSVSRRPRVLNWPSVNLPVYLNDRAENRFAIHEISIDYNTVWSDHLSRKMRNPLVPKSFVKSFIAQNSYPVSMLFLGVYIPSSNIDRTILKYLNLSKFKLSSIMPPFSTIESRHLPPFFSKFRIFKKTQKGLYLVIIHLSSHCMNI